MPVAHHVAQQIRACGQGTSSQLDEQNLESELADYEV